MTDSSEADLKQFVMRISSVYLNDNWYYVVDVAPYMTEFKKSTLKKLQTAKINHFLDHPVLLLSLTLYSAKPSQNGCVHIIDHWSEIVPHQCEAAHRLSKRVCMCVCWRSAHRPPACGTWVRMELHSATRISSSPGCRPSLDASASSTAVAQPHKF